ncbi:MAG: type IV pilin protein [Deltaproteobacteria bacterium]
MLRFKRNRKGFTLLELIIVVIVIGILASIALPRFIRVTERARIAEAKSILGTIRSAQMRYLAQWNAYATNPTVLDIPAMPGSKYFTYVVSNPGAAATTQPIVQVSRNAVEFPGAPFTAGYTITVSPDGNLATSDVTNVGPLL